ncbi:chlorophyll A-B binding protein [Aureococcus anophagefferens]|nr:chlorophyll A-B binding protein [Aureococcus anophagefferens]
MACLGYWHHNLGIQLPGYLSTTDKITFATSARVRAAAWAMIPKNGLLQIFGAIAAVEVYELTHKDGVFVGGDAWFKGFSSNLEFDPLGFGKSDPALVKTYKERELKNGRLAMIGIMGFAFAQCTVRLGAKVVVNSTRTNVTGAARFARGAMVDSSRHFLPVPTLEAILDGMAASALNRASGTLLDPLKEETYAFLGALFAELRGVFRDAAVHLGGDEVQFRCLNASADFRGRMVARGYDASCPAADPPKTGATDADHGDWRAFYDVHPRSSATRNASSRGYFNVTDPAEASRASARASSGRAR